MKPIIIQKTVYRNRTPWLGLSVLFLTVLKLTGYTDISWWWILLPIWLPFAILLFILILLGGLAVLFEVVDNRYYRK